MTIASLLELGFTMPQLRRLFIIESGLAFWYTGSAADELVSPVDVCCTEETFQVERRPMEIALTVLAQSCGVEVRSGTEVSTGRSRLDGPDPMPVMRGSSGAANPVRCRLVCDASGPASVMARSLGTHRKQKHINTNAYWSHFRTTASPACWPGVRRSADGSNTTEGRVLPGDVASISPKSVSAETITNPLALAYSRIASSAAVRSWIISRPVRLRAEPGCRRPQQAVILDRHS